MTVIQYILQLGGGRIILLDEFDIVRFGFVISHHVSLRLLDRRCSSELLGHYCHRPLCRRQGSRRRRRSGRSSGSTGSLGSLRHHHTPGQSEQGLVCIYRGMGTHFMVYIYHVVVHDRVSGGCGCYIYVVVNDRYHRRRVWKVIHVLGRIL